MKSSASKETPMLTANILSQELIALLLVPNKLGNILRMDIFFSRGDNIVFFFLNLEGDAAIGNTPKRKVLGNTTKGKVL